MCIISWKDINKAEDWAKVKILIEDVVENLYIVD